MSGFISDGSEPHEVLGLNFRDGMELNRTRHMHSIKPKDLSLSLGFQFFEYLGFGFGYFANLLQI